MKLQTIGRQSFRWRNGERQRESCWRKRQGWRQKRRVKKGFKQKMKSNGEWKRSGVKGRKTVAEKIRLENRLRMEENQINGKRWGQARKVKRDEGGEQDGPKKTRT